MDIQRCKEIFEKYGGMMRTKELEKEKVRYRTVHHLIEVGLVEKILTDTINGFARMTLAK